MKAIEEIGIEKSLSYMLFNLAESAYHILVDHILNFPPVRKIIFQLLGAKIGKNSVIMQIKFFNLHHKGFPVLSIGKECFIGDETLIDLYDKVILEDQVTIAQKVTVLTHLNVGYANHPLQKSFPRFSKPVIFKEGCVIGAASTILPGVIIGKQSFVAAGSVVTKNVPGRTLVAGVPAKIIRKIK